MMLLVCTALLACSLALAERAEHVQDACPPVTALRDFNSTKYLGAWFEVRRYPARFQQGASCVSSQYSLREDGNITVLARMFNVTTKKYVTMEGMMRPSNADSGGKLLVSFTTSQGEGDYWVLGTDYTSHAVVWWCRRNPDNHFSLYSWIISRSKKMSAEALSGVKKILAENNLSFDDKYLVTNQDNCPTENGDN